MLRNGSDSTSLSYDLRALAGFCASRPGYPRRSHAARRVRPIVPSHQWPDDAALWWSSGAESIQRLAAAEVALSPAWNGRPFLANKKDGRNFQIVWSAGGIVARDNRVIPKGTPHVEGAYKFLAFAARPDIGAASMKGIPYSVRQTAAHDLLSDEERGQLP